MKFRLLVVGFLAFISANILKAQDIEYGIFLGAANYQGDMVESAVDIEDSRLATGLVLRYYFNPRFNLRGNMNLGWVKGNDLNGLDEANPSNSTWESVYRQANFSTHIFEMSTVVEANLLPYISNSKKYKFAPYVFAGIGLFHFNPKAEYNGVSYVLQPLQTEGVEYNRLQGNIPYGLGFKYSLGKYWNIALEIGQRKLFTDYLDDVSATYAVNPQTQEAQYAANPRIIPGYGSNAGASYAEASLTRNGEGKARGNSESLDMYIFTGITLTKTIRKFGCLNF
jgi:hypothetical protein